MGLYYGYVIPFGAILVGCVAASGYALSAWMLGLKIRRWYFAVVILLLILCFFAAKYIEFRTSGPFPQSVVTMTIGGVATRVGIGQQGFFEHFHEETVNWTWAKDKLHSYDDDRKPPEKLGEFGYFFQILGIIGFCLGGAFAPLMLWATPYCELCERYMSNAIAATVPTAQSEARLARLKQAAKRGDVAGCRDALRAGIESPKSVKKLDRRTVFKLEFCKSCNAGKIVATDFVGHGKQMKSKFHGLVLLEPTLLKQLRGELGIGK